MLSGADFLRRRWTGAARHRSSSSVLSCAGTRLMMRQEKQLEAISPAGPQEIEDLVSGDEEAANAIIIWG
jgi:hypothetical protein